MCKEKAAEILKKHFKALYNYTGLEWTSDSDKDLERLVDGLGEVIDEKRDKMFAYAEK